MILPKKSIADTLDEVPRKLACFARFVPKY